MKMVIRNLHVAFGKSPVLQGISLGMADRAVTALIGPSGCGKSTLLRSLNRMHDLVSGVKVRGQISLNGRPIERYGAEELRCRVGMLFQRPNLFPRSIYANVAFGPSLFGLRGKELDEIVCHSLKRAALWDEVKRRLSADACSLSGGQQQRLCMARALALEPEVLLLDEPCSALDPASTQAIERLILDLKQEMAIVMVTHSMGQARRLADQVAFFEEGRLIEAGRADSILEHPQRSETARFLAM